MAIVIKEVLKNRNTSDFQRFSLPKKIVAGLVILFHDNLMQRLEITGRPAGLGFKHVYASVKLKRI